MFVIFWYSGGLTTNVPHDSAQDSTQSEFKGNVVKSQIKYTLFQVLA